MTWVCVYVVVGVAVWGRWIGDECVGMTCVWMNG